MTDARTENAITRRADMLAGEGFAERIRQFCRCPDCDTEHPAVADIVAAAVAWFDSGNTDELLRAVQRMRDPYIQSHRDLYRQAAMDQLAPETEDV